MSAKSLVWAAAWVGAAFLAGCGGAHVPARQPASEPAQPTHSVKVISSSYCRREASGLWVTDDSAQSTNPCVPDPSYATGDEAIDGRAPVPRCVGCTLSTWRRAEKLAAHVLATPGAAVATTPGITRPSRWPASVTDGYVYGCESTGGQEGSCQCMAGQLEQQVPPGSVGGLSAYDPRVQAAERVCPSGTT